MRLSISSFAFSRLAAAAAALWLCGAGMAWAGGGGESLTSLQAVIGVPDGSSGFCHMLNMKPCPQLPTFTQAILEAAGLANSPPEMIAAQNGLPPGNNVYATNPAAASSTPYPLPVTSPALTELLSTLTPLAFISSPRAATLPTPVQLYDSNANTFLYAVTVSSSGSATPPGGTVPDTLYLFYEDLSLTNQNLKSGQTVAKFSFPPTVLNSNGTETNPTNPPTVTLQFIANKNNDCSTSMVTGVGPMPVMASQIGVNCAVVFSASPISAQTHAIFELSIPLLVTGACSPTACPPSPNTDPAYFYALHNGVPGQLNVGLYTAFLFDDLGTPLTSSASLPSIGLAPTAGPLCPIVGGARSCLSSFTFALCANLPGNANGQAPLPSVAAYYAIATDGEALLSAALPGSSESSTSVCPAL